MVAMTKFFCGNWATRTYLLAVVVMSAGTVLVSRPACIVLIALTSPVAVIVAPISLLGDGWLTIPMLWLSVLAGFLLNTVLINMIVGAAESRATRHGCPENVWRT